MVLKALNLHREKNQPGPKPTPYIKINSKCVGLNIKSRTVKLSGKKKKKQTIPRYGTKGMVHARKKSVSWNSSNFKSFSLQKSLLKE